MAIFGPFTNASVVINAVDLSNRCKSVTINYSATMLDASAMGNTTRVNLAGIFDWNISVELIQDMAAGSVDATLFAAIGLAAFTIEVRATNSARSVTNPGFNGNCVAASYNPASGRWGDLLTCSATFQCASALLRSTA